MNSDKNTPAPAARVEHGSSRRPCRDSAGRFAPKDGAVARRGRRPGGQLGNVNSVRNPWLAFWRRRALRPEDRWALQLVRDYVPELVEAKGGPAQVSPAAERTMELAAVARVCWALALVGRDLAAVGRFLHAERGALLAIGLDRVQPPAVSFLDRLRARAAAEQAARDAEQQAGAGATQQVEGDHQAVEASPVPPDAALDHVREIQ